MVEKQLVGPENKICPSCKLDKPLTSGFHKNKAAPNGYQWHCIDCRKSIDSRKAKRDQYKRRYHEHKDSYFQSHYLRAYGITLDDYNNILTHQNGVCAICSETCATGRRLAVDHCHKTGHVRGLLCTRCNSMIGQAQDSKHILEKGIEYLQRHTDTDADKTDTGTKS